MNYLEFAKNIKSKYPQYNDMDDLELAQKVVQKYPQYNDISFEKEVSFVDKAKSVAGSIGSSLKGSVNTIGSNLKDSVNTIGSMVSKGASMVTKPAIKLEPAVSGALSSVANPAKVAKNVVNASTIKQQKQEPNNVVPVLRARNVDDDNLDYRFLQQNNPEYALSTEDKINIDKQGLVDTDPITPVLSLGMGATVGGLLSKTPALTKGGALLLEGLLQSKNAIVRGVKGEEQNPFEVKGVAELIPDDYPGVLKFGASLGEMLVDGVVAGTAERAITNKLVNNTGEFFRKTLLKKGYTKEQADKAVNRYKDYVVKRQTGMTQEQMVNASKSANANVGNGSGVVPFKSDGVNTGIIEQPKPISIDDAIKMNIQARTAKIPQAPKEPLKADVTVTPETEPVALVGGGVQNKAVNSSVAPIKQKWDSANKVVGNSDVQNYSGENIVGRYMLVEAGTPTASHNPFKNFVQTENFPTTPEGKTVNDRDYFNDKQAQHIVIDVATNYDSRALQDMPVVSKDGVVLSGNQRTMAGEVAAANNTDGAYIDYLKNYSAKYGFTPEQVEQFKHPRVVFVPDNDIEYTTKNFALFNRQATKTQNSLEQAVALGKTLSKEAINRINNVIARYDSLSDLYNNTSASANMINELVANNIISLNDVPKYTVNTGDSGYVLSETGKEFLENVLVGSAVTEDSLRALATIRNIKQRVIKSLYEMTDNNSLTDNYKLKNEISNAVKLLAQVRANNNKNIDNFLAQQDMFRVNYSEQEIELAKMLEESYKPFKRFLSVYNDGAKQAIEDSSYDNGGLLGQEPKTKNEIMQWAIELIDKEKNSQQKFEFKEENAQYLQEREKLAKIISRYNNNLKGDELYETAEAVQLTFDFEKAVSNDNGGIIESSNSQRNYSDRSSRGNNLSTSKLEQPNNELSYDRRIADTFVGLGITESLVHNGQFSLEGKIVRSPKDLAVAAQVLRNPRFETFHCFFTKNNKIIYHFACTTRISGSTKIDTAGIADVANNINFDGIYILHNHPSGEPKPSVPDIQSTISFRQTFRNKFKGHIVIDHNKYVIVDGFGFCSETKYIADTKTDKLLTISKPHRLLGTYIQGTDVLAKLAVDLQYGNNKSVIFYTTPKLMVRGVQVVDNSEFDDLDNILNLLYKSHEYAGSSTCFVVTDDVNVRNNADGIMKHYTKDTGIFDVVYSKVKLNKYLYNRYEYTNSANYVTRNGNTYEIFGRSKLLYSGRLKDNNSLLSASFDYTKIREALNARIARLQNLNSQYLIESAKNELTSLIEIYIEVGKDKESLENIYKFCVKEDIDKNKVDKIINYFKELYDRVKTKKGVVIREDNNKYSQGVYSKGIPFAKDVSDKVSGNSDKLYQRTYDLAKKYNVNIGEAKKYMNRNWSGVFFRKSENVFVRSLLNITTVVHEVVHALDKRNGIIDDLLMIAKGSPLYPVQRQLRDCAIKYYGLKSMFHRPKELQLREGITTLIQIAIVNPGFVYKNFKDAFDYLRLKYPVIDSVYKDGRQIVVDYEGLDAVGKVASEIYTKPLQVVKKRKVPLSVKIDRQFFDSEAPLRWLDENLYVTAKGYKTILRGIIENNISNKDGVMYVIDSEGNPVEANVGDNWKTFINTVEKLDSKFDEYLVARRFVSWYRKIEEYKQDIVSIDNEILALQQKLKVNPNDIVAIAKLDKNVKLKQEVQEKMFELIKIVANHNRDRQTMEDAFIALNNDNNKYLARRYDKLMQCSLDTLRNARVIDQEMYVELAYNYGYAPFRKQQYNEIIGDGSSFVQRMANKNQLAELKKIKGSELPIVSPLFSSVHFMISSYRKAYQQIVYNKVAQIADMYPDLFQPVDYKPGLEKDRNVVIGVIKGKKVAVVCDGYIKDVVEHVFDVLTPNFAEECLLMPARVFTQTTTGLYPLYAPINFIRDQITAFVNTHNNYIPIVSSVNVLTSKKYRPYFKEYVRLFGVDNNTLLGALNEIDPSELGKAMAENNIAKAAKIVGKVVALPANVSETITRAVEYCLSRFDGNSVKVAKRHADEVSAPFGDRGFWFGRFGQTGVKSVPYFNSTLQVARQALRSVASSKNIYRFLFAVVGIAVAVFGSVYNILQNGTEEEKRNLLNLQAEMLTMYVYLPMSNKDKQGLIRIPIDQTYSFIGVVFAMLYANAKGANYKLSDFVQAGTSFMPEQLNIFESGAKAVEGDWSGVQRQIVSSLPHIAKTGVSLITGKRTFPNMTDIEPKYLQSRPVTDRYNERTSEPAKWLGKKLNMSPMYIDYAIDQLGGRTTRLGGRAVEAMVYDSKDKKDNLGMMTNPFLAVPYFSSGRVLQDFYHDKKLVDQLYVVHNNGIRQLTSEELSFARSRKPWTDTIGKKLQEYGKIKKFVTDNKNDLSLDEQEKYSKSLLAIEAEIWKGIKKYQNATKKGD